MSALVLGIDPGPTNNGYALLDFAIPMAPVWHTGGVTKEILGELKLWLDLGRELRVDLVCIEQARALHNPMANVAVMGTAWAGGVAAGYATALGADVVTLGPNEWQVALVGHSRKGDNVDRKVEAFLRQHVRQFPARTNVHSRDAAAVAIVGYRVAFDRRFGSRLRRGAAHA